MKFPSLRLSPRTIFRRLFKTFLVLGIIALLGVAIAGSTVFFVYRQLAATYDISKLGQMPSHSQVFDGDGKPYGRLQNDQNRVVVPLKDVSPHFIDAILAREDSRFWQHHGVDFHGIARALLRNIESGGTREGASTITQQLARNSLSLGGQNLHRKMIEAMVAFRIEEKYTKEQILEFYINRIYLGSGVYGVEAASQKYFGKPSKQLTLGESAMLAGIVRNPNRNSPLKNMEGARADRDTVLDRLVELQKIPAKEAAVAKAEPIKLSTAKAKPLQEDYVLDAVRNDLDDLVGVDAINEGGLKIYTTVDQHLQQLASNAVEDQLATIESTKGYGHLTREQYRTEIGANGQKATKPDASPEYLQGALLAVDNHTGAILALVGGRNFEESRYNRALLARRQIGSTFKPFVYAAAFARGLQPGSLVDDSPLRPGEIKGQKDWKPVNSDAESDGMQPAEIGLIHSRNLMTIRVGEYAGMDNVLTLARKAGLTEAPRFPSMYIGSFETSLKSLTSAYTVFPNHGVEHPAYLIERIDAANGQTLYQRHPEEVKVMSETVAQTTSDILERVLIDGTGKQAASFGFKLPGAGKTGTTNDYKDAWFLGYTTSITCGVWVGMDRPQTITAKGYGATLALPIWADFMESAATASKRFPALALHNPPPAAPQIRAVAAGPADQPNLAYADYNRNVPGTAPGTAAAPGAPTMPAQPEAASETMPPAPAAPLQPPADPGSHFITDPATGRVIGIDGSAAATEEEQRLQQLRIQQQQLLQQQQLQQQRAAELKRQQELLRQQPPPVQAANDPNARVLPAVPVQSANPPGNRTVAPIASQGGRLPAVADVPVKRALPVAPVPERTFEPSTNRFSNSPRGSSDLPASIAPRRRQRIYTLPDGRQVTERELEEDQ